MILYISLLFNFFFGVSTEARHPFHITVTEINHRPDQKTIQVSVRLFLDDFEVGLKSFSDNKDLDIVRSDATYLREEIGKYILQKLKLTTKKDLELKYLGFEYEEDVLWCYFEATKVKPFQELQIRNSLLVDSFDDQENLVHIRKNGKVKSLRLGASREFGKVEWETK